METKMLKFIMFACLIAGVSSASAQNSAHEGLALSSCSVWSKDPKCWEDKDGNSARPPLNLPESSCGVIESVHPNSSGYYHCKSADGSKFDCNKLVKEFGDNLEGVSVKITTHYVDGCHIPGGCGGRGWVSGYGVASLDPFCQ